MKGLTVGSSAYRFRRKAKRATIGGRADIADLDLADFAPTRPPARRKGLGQISLYVRNADIGRPRLPISSTSQQYRANSNGKRAFGASIDGWRAIFD
jgi:hypothetical protein